MLIFSKLQLDVQCSASYIVFGALGSKDVSADQIQTASSTMSLHLTWNKFSTTLLPPRDAKSRVVRFSFVSNMDVYCFCCCCCCCFFVFFVCFFLF